MPSGSARRQLAVTRSSEHYRAQLGRNWASIGDFCKQRGLPDPDRFGADAAYANLVLKALIQEEYH